MQRNVLQYLEKAVQNFPDKIAIEDEYGTVTFKKLQQNALAISGYLLEEGFQGCQPVAVLMPKSIKAIEAFLGILYAGGFYVPLDTGNPKSRIQTILNNIEPKFVISEDRYRNLLNGVNEADCFVDLGQAIKSESKHSRYLRNIDTDPLYILNTSGSTGIPKGVTLTHRCMIDYIDWVVSEYEFDNSLVIGNQSPLHFDISASDLYVTLATGSKLVLIPERHFMFPVRLIEFLKEKNVNFLYWVPSIISNVSKLDVLKNVTFPLRFLFYGGELMPTKHLMYWKRNLPDAVYSNFYGPTEVTVICTHYRLDRMFDDSDPLPIGFPCGNTDVLVLDEKNQLVSDAYVSGELCVRGNSLAMGYYNDLEKTEQAFVQNPNNPHYPERIYRTGDVVYYNDRGELMYKGRKDFQIKHMGYRIELGEIETAVLGLDGVDKACVLYDSENKNIVLIYESASGSSQKEILLALHGQLPKYMLPTRFELVETMPLNMNGKIDRQRLTQEHIHV